ncbi:hypothetical protein [Marinobacter sp. OP 3.4]|uniref:hypothetical protein n=1 Tax=Marinobacter sp. OP 3.4 TaxID=3076501 RepID=UPI002E22E0A2
MPDLLRHVRLPPMLMKFVTRSVNPGLPDGRPQDRKLYSPLALRKSLKSDTVNSLWKYFLFFIKFLQFYTHGCVQKINLKNLSTGPCRQSVSKPVHETLTDRG